MISESDKWRISHIMEAIENIEDFVKDIDEKHFLENLQLQTALVRMFEIIGEAANNLSVQFLAEHKEINWREVIGMRHAMIHDYFEVNLEVVWDTIKEDIPKLKAKIKKLLKQS